jgi:hypothetical protein
VHEGVAPRANEGLELGWDDEFDGRSLDTTQWTYVVGAKAIAYYTARPQIVLQKNKRYWSPEKPYGKRFNKSADTVRGRIVLAHQSDASGHWRPV